MKSFMYNAICVTLFVSACHSTNAANGAATLQDADGGTSSASNSSELSSPAKDAAVTVDGGDIVHVAGECTVADDCGLVKNCCDTPTSCAPVTFISTAGPILCLDNQCPNIGQPVEPVHCICNANHTCELTAGQ